MIGKMHVLLARMTTMVFVEYSIVAAAVIVVVTNILLAMVYQP
jgi:hypothetical protein